MTNCIYCKNKINLIDKIFFHQICTFCRKKQNEKEEKELKRKSEKQELIDKAKQIILNHAVYWFDNEKIENAKDLIFVKEISGSFCINNIGYEYSEKEIIDSLIENKFDLEKAINFLNEEKTKYWKEYKIQEKMNKIKQAEERRLIREEAEKLLYGKIKTKRKILTKEEKDIIFSKFNNACGVCEKKEGLHIHHKDKNPSNNKLSNLIILCGVCHKKIHMKVR